MNFGFSPALSPSSSKHRRPLSPEVSDHESYNVPLPSHPVPSTSSSAPARKKKKNSQPSVDVAAVMQSLLQALQQQTKHSSSESSDEELFREPSSPPILRESPLAVDLALYSDENEGPPSFASELPIPCTIPCASCSTHIDVPSVKGEDFSDSLAPQDQLAPPPGQDLSMPDPKAVLSEAPPLDAPHNISPQTPALDTTPSKAPLVESSVVLSVDNVTT